MSEVEQLGTQSQFVLKPCRKLKITNFTVKMPDPINGVSSEQPKLHNGRPLYIRVKPGPYSDPMCMWYVPNPNPNKAGLWMVNNRSQFDNPEPTAKAAVKDAAMTPNLIQGNWKAYNPAAGNFEANNEIVVEFLTEREKAEVHIEKMTVEGRLGYNRAMNGTYIRGKKPHCGKSYYRHTENDFTIRWFDTKWVVDWRGLHNDNIGAAVCKEDVPEPWMCTIPWRIYDGKARDKKWKFDQNVKMKPVLTTKSKTGTFE
jgi:hypothetical protein